MASLPFAALSDQISPWTLLLVAAVHLSFRFLFSPWVRQRKHLIDCSANLPGPPVGSSHRSPWLHDISDLLQLPPVPGRPALKQSVPWFVANCKKYYEEGGHGLFRIWAFSPYRLPFARCIVTLFDPDLIMNILGPKGYGKFSKGRVFHIASPLVGNSILSLGDGQEWKRQRKLASPAFGQTMLERVTEVSAQLLREELFPTLDSTGGRDTNIIEYAYRATLDVLGHVAFSFPFDGIKSFDPNAQGTIGGASLYETFNTITEIVTLRSRSTPFRKYLPTRENLRFARAVSRLNSVIGQIVTKRTEEQIAGEKADTNSGPRNNDLLSQLLLKDEGGHRLSHKYILGNVRMFLFAGHETTAATLSWALWHLATNPDMQKNLRKEIDPLFSSKGSENIVPEMIGPSCAELRQLKYLDAVIKETLRLNPPAGVSRRALQDITIGPSRQGKTYIIPKGAECYVFPWWTHHQSHHWHNPDQFDPDRFLSLPKKGGWVDRKSEDGEASPSRPFLPFSIGPRSCMGQQLALAEIRSMIAQILHRYDVEPAKGAVEPIPFLAMTVAPNEIRLNFQKRSGP